MSILLLIIVLAVLILAHEFGHFIVAKKAGIKVEEFGLGFPPRIWGWKYGETTYSFNWIPFGGFVKILGENPDEEQKTEITSDSRSFQNKPRSIQALVLAAGVTFNVLLAWLLLVVGLSIGLPSSIANAPAGYTVSNPQLLITDTLAKSPAALAGLKSGMIILYVERDGVSRINQPDAKSLREFIGTSVGQTLTLGIKGDFKDESSGDALKQFKEIKVKPITGLVPDQAAIGISMDTIGILKLPFSLAFVEAAKLTLALIVNIALALKGILVGIFMGQTTVLSSVAGPVGLVTIVGSSFALGFPYLLNLVAVISINLAVINVLPFPALDGGRLLVLLIETIGRRPLNSRLVNAVNTVGFVLLIILMILVTYKDIARLVTS